MTAGIPGTGIGGVFYLISAFFMPLFEIVRTLRGESSLARWRFVIRQLAMAMTIVFGMWLLGLALGLFVHGSPALDMLREMHGQLSDQVSAHVERITTINVFHIAPVIMSTATLLFILTFTQVLRLVYRPATRP